MSIVTASALALLAAVAASLLVVGMAVRAWRAWRAVRRAQRAAVALLDVHLARFDQAAVTGDLHAGVIADRGELLAGELAQLRADAAHLRWLGSRIRQERARLNRELLDLLLPTSDADDRERADA